MRTAVGITVFRPDRALLVPLVDGLLASGRAVFVHVDGPAGLAIDEETLQALRVRAGLCLIEAPANRGIGAGLNALAEAAQAAGASHLLLFDQDSSPATDLPERLEEAFAALERQGERPAALGPCPVVPAGETGQPPRYVFRDRTIAGCRATDYVITSGSLVDLAALAAVGPFRADYFIDGIDVEWSLRAWARGWSIWLAEGIEMPHRIGHGVVSLGPIRFPDQSEARMLTYVRNRAAMLRLAHVPFRWKARSLVYLPLQALAYARGRGGWPLVRRLAGAAADGWRGRLENR